MNDLDPEINRKNIAMGWALFVFCVLLMAGTFAVAFIYLAAD